MKDFKEVWKFPLKLDDWGCYVWDANHNMALQFELDFDEYKAKQIVNCINGNEKFTVNDILFDFNSADFYSGIEPIMCIRGWGHLTGIGGLNLQAEEAEYIQNQFAKFIIERLS